MRETRNLTVEGDKLVRASMLHWVGCIIRKLSQIFIVGPVEYVAYEISATGPTVQ